MLKWNHSEQGLKKRRKKSRSLGELGLPGTGPKKVKRNNKNDFFFLREQIEIKYVRYYYYHFGCYY